MSGATTAYFLRVGFSLYIFTSWFLEGHEFFNFGEGRSNFGENFWRYMKRRKRNIQHFLT